MKLNDLNDRSDIDRLMLAFYRRAMADPELGHIFTDIAQLDLDHHLPIIGDFWETMLFRNGNYQRHGRNPMEVHARLDAQTPLLPKHFERWLFIFTECVDSLFAGEHAELVKTRAAAIAARMLEYLGRGAAVPISRRAAALV